MNYDLELPHLLSKLPHKRQVRFALDCALDVKHLLKDVKSLRALEVTALWLEDKATEQEIIDAANAIYSTYADYAVYAAVYAVYATDPYATYASVNAAHVAAYHAAEALNLPLKHYYTKLIRSLTALELVIYDMI